MTLPADDYRLQGLDKKVSLKVIEECSEQSSGSRFLLCRDCEEVVFFCEKQEIWSTKDNGLIELPRDVSATIYKGYYSVTLSIE